MKKILLLIFFLSPFLVQSKVTIPFLSSTPKIETNVDSFTGETTIASGWEEINSKTLWIKLIYRDGKEFIEMKYISGEQLNITPETPLLIQAEKGVGKFIPVESYGSGIGKAAINGQGERIWGISALYAGNLEIFDNGVTNMRISTLEGNKDFKLSKGKTKHLIELYKVFKEEVMKVKELGN